MAGHLYLVCIDCITLAQEDDKPAYVDYAVHPDNAVVQAAAFSLFGNFEDDLGFVNRATTDLEEWLRYHVQGNCAGAIDQYGTDGVIEATRIETSIDQAWCVFVPKV